MRITNKMVTNAVLDLINVNLQRVEEYQRQLSSGKRVNLPSDDPIATARLLTIKTELSEQEQYQKNMEDAMGWLDTADGALARASDVLQRARELAVYGANGTLPQQSLDAIADEVDKLTEEMVQIANTNYAGRFVFGGGHTTQLPYSISGRENQKVTEVSFINSSVTEEELADTFNLDFEVESGVAVNIAVGKMTFHTDTEGNEDVNAIFDMMIELRKNLENGNAEEINKRITEADKFIDNILSERAIIGAKSKRMESASERADTYKLRLNELIGSLEDVDYAEAIMNFKVQQAVYQAALATGAQILQPSLIDYLT